MKLGILYNFYMSQNILLLTFSMIEKCKALISFVALFTLECK